MSHGWKFDFTHDGSIKRKTGNKIGMKCGAKAKWHGWREHFKVRTLSAVLKDSGEVTLDFGNCRNEGNVKVYLDSTLIATAPAGRRSIEKSFAFTPGSVLKIKDEVGNAVLMLNSITFSCRGTFLYKHKF